MKTFKRILLGLLILLAIVAIAGYFFVNHIAKKALPDYNKPVGLIGLIDEVNVYRDAYAVPHIYAQNEHDLYLTTGYLMAQDRLWQMDLLRRVTMGRLSEIFGEDMIGADHLLRALRIPKNPVWFYPEPMRILFLRSRLSPMV
jgi:penicillin G amidase